MKNLPRTFWLGLGLGFVILLAIAAVPSLNPSPATPNKLQKATGTNSIGDSGISDSGTGSFQFGGAASSILLSPTNNPNGNGLDMQISSSSAGVNGRGGDLSFTATDGVNAGRGGNMTFTVGQGGGGGGTAGEMLFSAPGTGARIRVEASDAGEVIYDVPILYPSSNNTTHLGTNSNRWKEVWSQGQDVDGDIRVSGNVSPRDVPYIWPATQGLTNTITTLQNDGAGNLSWNVVSSGTTVSVNGTNVTTPNITNTASVTWSISGASNILATAVQDTTATNIVTIGQVGTNGAQLDFSLVARGGVFKISLTNNCYFSTPANVNNTDFKQCWLAVKQPSTGTCLVTFTNGVFSQPGGSALINDTNNGAVVWYHMVSNPFTNGLVDVWMSQKSQLP